MKAFTKEKQTSQIYLKTCSTTAISPINKMELARSKGLFKLTVDLWQYCMKKQPTLIAEDLQRTLSIKQIKNLALSTTAKSLLQGKLSSETKMTYEGSWKCWHS